MDDIFAVDFYVGLGIGAKHSTLTQTTISTNSSNKSEPSEVYVPDTGMYGFVVCTGKNGQIGLTSQVGLKVGMLIGSKKKPN